MSTSAAGRAWTSSALPGVTLIQAELGGHRFPPHIHRQYVVGVSECGRHRAWRRGEEVLLSPAHVSVVAPEEVHAAEALPGEAWSWRSFHLEPEMIAGVVAPRGGGLPATRPVREHARLAGTLLAAHRALDEGG
ncbi:MAG TPA: AraC family ligand binding domain-containing protein, partial [Thermoanaerobaculia bacterium]|nr:AraC family ligand binding domain-containing protein [Thermoanaerobaculia bacterium]